MKKISCPFCDDNYTSPEGLYAHLEDEHREEIPDNFTPERYVYYIKTGKTHGNCIMCKDKTGWNDKTHKYHRFCEKESCKKKYIELFRKRMVGKYGKTTLMNDPEHQKNMLAHRKISGTYTWTDGTKKTYTGTYELDFLKFLDIFMGYDSSDIITPSPHTYYYTYEGEKKFYIPDAYIPSLNLEIEIKDGGDNPNRHPKIIKIDKEKERLKDEVMYSLKERKYIKVTNKNYDNFFEFLTKEKEKFLDAKNVNLDRVVKEATDFISNAQSEILPDKSIQNEILTESFKDKINEILLETSKLQNTDLEPVYVVLFSNDTDFGKMIRDVTGSDYSHATISLDPSLNDMYSFSDIPYSKLKHTGAGFVRESLWSPMYKKNRYFTILVTFVTHEQKKIIEKKIAYFKEHFYQFKYNDIGLVQYYLRFKNKKKHDEHKKTFWFCSEFVSAMLNAADVEGFENILMSPQDIKSKSGVQVLQCGNYTISTFSEKKLIRRTNELKKDFINVSNKIATESFGNIEMEILEEFNIKDLIKKKPAPTYKERDVHLYSSLVDWKSLYNEYVEYFKGSTEELRFDLFELIIRRYLIPLKKDYTKTTKLIIDEMHRIHNKIKATTIDAIDIINSEIVVGVSKIKKYFSYPTLTEIKREERDNK